MNFLRKVAAWLPLIIVTILAFAVAALAADPSPLPSVAATGVAPAVVIGGWTSLVSGFSSSAIALGIGAVLEVVLRILPTQKPLSIGYAIADACHALGSLFDALGGAADKVLPNRLKSG